MKKLKYRIKDCPNTQPIWNYIRIESKIMKYYTMTPECDASDVLTLKHDFNILSIIDSVKDAITKFDQLGWNSSDGRDPHYKGLSLVYNPEYSENENPNYQTLGTIKNKADQFFYGKTENFKTTRNTYFDSYAFRKLSPCVTETSLKSFIQSFNRPLIRSRIATVFSKGMTEHVRKTGGWHRDEVVFENLRINIPITTDENFLFEVKNKPTKHLSVGNAYSWDTNIAHRAVVTTDEDRSRTHLVLGVSPWFDYDEEEDAYVSNDFFGEMHPFDMLLSGNIHPAITGKI
jgi:hypothetical protein